jgi:hypothetical protein
MGQILQFVRPIDAFDPETLTILGEAYDKAVASLKGGEHRAIVLETMALRVLDLAAQGERDPERLCQAARRGLAPPIGRPSWRTRQSILRPP